MTTSDSTMRLPSKPISTPAEGRLDPPVIDSARLFQGRIELVIRHNGRDYRLRHTRLGKLILTA